MKLNLSLCLLITFFTTFAHSASIEFNTEEGGKVIVSYLDGTNEIDESEMELAWEYDGQHMLYTGNICFNGKRSDVRKLLKELGDEFFGGEYSIDNTWYVGRDKIGYQVYDGPNEMVSTTNLISYCN